MTIKDFGARVISVWEGLRPMTKKMLVGALQSNIGTPVVAQARNFYDAHADWELSRLLTVLDEQTKDSEVRRDAEKLREISQLANTCASVLQAQTQSAEIFIQLAGRALQRSDFRRIDELADMLVRRFSAGEVAEIVRQTDMPQIRAIAFETLAIMPVISLLPLLEDSLYYDIVRNAIEQQAFEFENQDAQRVLDQLEFDDDESFQF
jgi:hypothetical protein